MSKQEKSEFRSSFGENIFKHKYALRPDQTWKEKAKDIVKDVTTNLFAKDQQEALEKFIEQQKFLPGGRYIYYAGRAARFYNNCYLLKGEEDTREEWGQLLKRSSDCLMSGGGIGIDYSVFRPAGAPLGRTGGTASGPIPLMCSINEVGRNVMQGGSRRSAIYASLNWRHGDADRFLSVKNWHDQVISNELNYTVAHAKRDNFNHNAQLDMTNISLNYDDAFLDAIQQGYLPETFVNNCRQALSTGEPGFSFNFGDKENETLRNAPLSGSTYVLCLDQGYTQIRDTLGKEVSVWTGQQWAQTEFKLTAENAPVVKVSMSGGRSIVAEPTHEFFLKDGTKVPAASLEPGMELLVSLPMECDSFFDAQFYTLGYIYGDGSFHKRYPRAEITFCTEASKECVAHMYNPWISSVNPCDNRGYTRLYTKPAPLLARRDKAVFPDDVYGMGTQQVVSFIAGLFDSDGSYDNRTNRVRLSSKHFDFLRGVQRLLEQVGILSGISSSGISSFGQNVGYLLTVATDCVSRFSEIIPTVRLDIKPCTSYRKSFIKVQAVEDYGYEDVYCCDVRVPEHSFVAEGVVVSNCTEVTSADDSDVCNLGSVNMGRIDSIKEFREVVRLASGFLVCGTITAELPYKKVYEIRKKNRRLGLGLMGIHEWLLKRGYRYEMVPELRQWLEVYREESERAANSLCDRLSISRPVAYRAIAPTGTIGIIAGTTTGIEPLFAVAYKRRYLVGGSTWKYEYVVDATAEALISEGIAADSIETAVDLASDFQRRIAFQADVQDYVDMAISSTINLPAWGSDLNNPDTVLPFANILAKYAPRLRGFTAYPDSARGGQPLESVSYKEAMKHKGVVFEENDSCKGGVCGI